MARPETKALINRRAAAYRKTEVYKAYRKAYAASGKAKEANVAYANSSKGRESHRKAAAKYLVTENGKMKHRSDANGYYSRHRESIKTSRVCRKFGITKSQYRAMLASQGGKCAICGTPPGSKRLALDHCHATGTARKLLCSNCNTALGLFKDNPDRLKAAAEYLLSFQQATSEYTI